MEQRIAQLEEVAAQFNAQLQQTQAELQAAQHAAQAAEQANNVANAAVANLVAQAGAGGGGGGGQVIRLQRYDHGGDNKEKRTVEFYRWINHLRHAAFANGWNTQRTIDTSLGSLDGVAADTTRAMVRNAAAYNNDTETFLSSLQRKFVSATYETVARVKFSQRRQLEDESIEIYHGQLSTLYEQAFAHLDEPWRYIPGADPPDPWQANDPVGHRSRRLMEQFVSGLRNYTVKSQYRLSQTLIGMPETYDLLLERIMSLEGHQEQNQYESSQLRRGGKDTVYTGNRPPPRGGGEPMDIGALSRKVAELEKKYSGRNRVGAAAGAAGEGNRSGKWCTYHNVSTHDSRECRAQKGEQPRQGGQAARGQGGEGNRQGAAGGQARQASSPRYHNNNKYNQNQQNRPGNEKRGPKCRNCDGFGHIYNQCPSPKKKVAGLTDAGKPTEEPEDGNESDSGDSQWAFETGTKN